MSDDELSRLLERCARTIGDIMCYWDTEDGCWVCRYCGACGQDAHEEQMVHSSRCRGVGLIREMQDTIRARGEAKT